MRRLRFGILGGSIGLLLAVGPVPADTSPNGSSFFSASTDCNTSGNRQVCTDTILSVISNEDGSDGPPCLEVHKYSFGSNGRFTEISDEFGCATEGTITVGADLSVTLDPTDITLQSCGRRSCTGSRTVTVSAQDSPTGPVSTPSTRLT